MLGASIVAWNHLREALRVTQYATGFFPHALDEVGMRCAEGALRAGMSNDELGLRAPQDYRAGDEYGWPQSLDARVGEAGDTVDLIVRYGIDGEDGAPSLHYRGRCDSGRMRWRVEGDLPERALATIRERVESIGDFLASRAADRRFAASPTADARGNVATAPEAAAPPPVPSLGEPGGTPGPSTIADTIEAGAAPAAPQPVDRASPAADDDGAATPDSAHGRCPDPAVSRQPHSRPRRCTAALAGLGTGREGLCGDPLAIDLNGPVMVVVPAGGRVSRPFAIGRYEISLREIGRWCCESGECGAGLDRSVRPELPATDLSIDVMRRYSAWLSEAASRAAGAPRRYRLPTADEWRRAAEGQRASARRRDNCRPPEHVDIGPPRLVDARSGAPNGWGIANLVGNARELAVAEQGRLAAHGASYGTRPARCTAGTVVPHDGSPDPETGFRVVLELP